MRRVYTSAISAKVVKFQTLVDLSARSLVVKAMGRKQPCAHPEAGISVLLSDRKYMASSCGVNANIRVYPISPLRNFRVVVNAAAVLGLRAKLHVIGITARAIAAKMVKGKAFWNRSETLTPVPAMCKPEPAIAPDATVPVYFVGRQFPASGPAVDGVLMLPSVAGAVHRRLAGDIPQLRLFGNGRGFAASALTDTARVSDPLSFDFVVAPQKPDVASRYKHFGGVGSVCETHGCATATDAFPGRIRAARVIRLDGIPSDFPLRPMADSVAQKFAGYLKRPTGDLGALRLLATTVHAKPARVRRREIVHASCPRPHLVAVNESPTARRSFISAVRDFSALALARLAKIDVGHVISSKDPWFWLAGAHTLSQPFHCIVEEAM